MIENTEFISSFVEEATGHVNNLEAGLLNIDTGNPDMEAINDLFRAVHSIKGTAGFFNLINIVSVSHCMENVFDECRNGSRKLTDNDVDNLLAAIDCLKEMIADVLNSEEYDASHVLSTLEAMHVKKKESSGPAAWDSSKTKECDIRTETEPEAEPLILNRPSSIAVEDSVRVGVSLLNSLLNLASEMVLNRNQLLRNLEPYRRNIIGIDPILQSIDHITTQLQETIMQTRMQPVANVFNKFPRIIRDLSKKLNKEIELCIEGADVEMDRTIIESLADPLTHLVRNSADHGLESSAERLSAGKPPVGQIKIKAYHEGGYVNIDIIDDGRGIDIEKVKQKAAEKGLIDRKNINDYSEREILQFLFEPGFSTKTAITDMSGRGVGLDVVKTNIEKLGGSIEIFTSPGNGTTIRLLLPLTLAIIPSLIVEVANQKFALPQANLQEIVRIKPGDVSRRIEYIHNSEVLRLRGRLLPIVHLATALGLKRTYIDPVSGERKEERRKTLYDQRRKDNADYICRRTGYSNIVRIIVLKTGSRCFGIAVDHIHGSEEILVKALPKYVSECKCYSGVTIMGDGKIAMILDPEGIVQKAGMRFTDEMEDKSENDIEQLYESMREQQNLLIFRASGEEYLGIDLSLVSRVEEIKAEDIELVGDKEYIRFRNSSMRVIRPEKFLPISLADNKPGKYYVIVPKLIKNPMGIIAHKIEDTIRTSVSLDQETITGKGLFGSFIYNNKIILILNIYELFELVDPIKYAVKACKAAKGKNRVLLVEDTPFFLKIEYDYLTSAGYNVTTARNGKEAMRILNDEEFDIVISDISMPVMDGIELAKRIRLDKKYGDMPVIALTSLARDDQIKAGLDAGFDFYEVKLDKSSLLEKVELALKKRELVNL